MIKKLAMTTASVLLMTTGAFAAEEYANFGEAGGWTVWANKTSGGCFIENRNNNGNAIQMGLRTNKDKVAFIGVWNHNNTIMEPGEKRDMKLDVDGRPYTFEATANENPVTDGLTGGYMWLNNPDFISDVENGHVMTIHTSADTSFEINLDGTKKSLEMARDCFAAQNN